MPGASGPSGTWGGTGRDARLQPPLARPLASPGEDEGRRRGFPALPVLRCPSRAASCLVHRVGPTSGNLLSGREGGRPGIALSAKLGLPGAQGQGRPATGPTETVCASVRDPPCRRQHGPSRARGSLTPPGPPRTLPTRKPEACGASPGPFPEPGRVWLLPAAPLGFGGEAN